MMHLKVPSLPSLDTAIFPWRLPFWRSFFNVFVDRIPAMPTQPFEQHVHRKKEMFVSFPPLPILGAIHKLLSRTEMFEDPQALQAVSEEGDGARNRQVWDDSDCVEKAQRLTVAKDEGKVIHIADIVCVASKKHWESPGKRKYKGRLVLRGDDVRDIHHLQIYKRSALPYTMACWKETVLG